MNNNVIHIVDLNQLDQKLKRTQEERKADQPTNRLMDLYEQNINDRKRNRFLI